MAELRFDNRVAVITGGGRGLGRSYALLLASRGAKIVVNDLGVTMRGEKADAGPADEVVREIKAAGGQAVASSDSVATEQGGKAIIQKALDSFGRVDILIHSAGNVRRAPLKEMSYEDFNSVLDVHLRGGFNVLRPALPHMSQQKYGRIVLTSSCNGVYGKVNVGNYCAAKAGLIGLSHTVAIEGAADNIKSNAIIPGAVTRMAEGIDTSGYPPHMGPDIVAPLVGWLVHESCPLSGEILSSVGGRMSVAYMAESKGVFQKEWTIDQIAAQSKAILKHDPPVIFPILPNGNAAHLQYAFDMSKTG